MTPWSLLQSVELVLSVETGGSADTAMSSASGGRVSYRSIAAVSSGDVDDTEAVLEVGEVTNQVTGRVVDVVPHGSETVEVDVYRD